jgi:hypothetical protein
LGDFSLIDNNALVYAFNGFQPMGNHDDCLSLCERFDCFRLHRFLQLWFDTPPAISKSNTPLQSSGVFDPRGSRQMLGMPLGSLPAGIN